MSYGINLTDEPVQITDGSKSAHVTVAFGPVGYANEEKSPAWHKLIGALSSNKQPVWMKSTTGAPASIVVTILEDE